MEGEEQYVSAAAVLGLTALMAAASGLGAVPFFFVGTLSARWSALANAVACGVMLAASFDLVHEGEPYGPGLVIVGVMLGSLFIWSIQKWLDQFEDVKFETLRGASARKVLLVVGIMAAHALGEGSGVGVSFCGQRGWSQGILVTLAIGLHNVPEGLATATVLVARGIPASHAFWWTLATSLPQPLLALPSFVFVDAFSSLLPLALGFAAGCMVWMVFAELLPDALADAPHTEVATAATMSAAGLEAMRMALYLVEQSARAPNKGTSITSAGLLLAGMLFLAALPALLAGMVIIAVAPPLAVRFGAAAGMVACLGAVTLTRSAASGGLGGTAAGALAGVAATWQGLRMVQAGLAEKAVEDKDADAGDVESQSAVISDGVALSTISLEGSPPLNGLKNLDGRMAGPFKSETAVRHKVTADSRKSEKRNGHRSRIVSSQLLRQSFPLTISVLLLLSVSDGERAASVLSDSLIDVPSLLARASARWGLIGAAGACVAVTPVIVPHGKACAITAVLSSAAPVFLFILYMLDHATPLLGNLHLALAWLERFAAGAALYVGGGLLLPIGRQQNPALALRFGLLGGLGTVLLSGMASLNYAAMSA
ncbi:probable zinc transporter ZIP11 at N-terminal half [Coccomyxa sp. Obi]|nr:probable zinc transporter ZIP11 at N-terminal half [Coccomyxa sp. Obi]